MAESGLFLRELDQTPRQGSAASREKALWYATDLLLAGRYAEQQRGAVRSVRHGAMEDLKKAEKDGVISQDEHKRLQAEVQKLTDEAVRRVDEALKTKEQEIMQV